MNFLGCFLYLVSFVNFAEPVLLPATVLTNSAIPE